MKSCGVLHCCVAAFFGCLAIAHVSRGQPADAGDEAAIRGLIERINTSMNADTVEKGVQIMSGVISDKAYTIVYPKGASEAGVGDKKALLEVLAQSLRDGPRMGFHKIQKIVIVGPIAYEIGRTISNQDAKDEGVAWLNVFAKEDVGWRLVYGSPAAWAPEPLRQVEPRKSEPAK